MLKVKEWLKSGKWSKKKIISLAVVLVVAAAAFVYLNNNKANKAVTADFLTAPVQRGDIQQTIEGTGFLQPSERFVLKTKTSGTVEEVMVAEGTQVNKGDPILVIRNEKVDSQSRQAALQWELAQKDLADLLNPSADSYDLRAAELKVEQSRIALEEKKEQQKALVLRAPFDGTILDTKVSVGQKVNAGEKAFHFATSDKMEVVAQISQRDISVIGVGMQAVVYVNGIQENFYGKVKEIDYLADSSTGNFDVVIELDKADPRLTSGMQASCTIIVVNDPDQELHIFKYGNGYVRYASEEEIATEVAGTVAEIYLKPGTKVYKGEPLLRLENPEIDRQVKDAELQLQNAEDSLRLLLEPDEETIKQQQLKVEQSYENYLSAKEKSDSLYVTSPIDGVVVKLSVSPGEELSSENLEQELVVVSSFKQTKLEISVDELDINKLKLGQEAVVTVDALPEARLKGEIIGIAYEGTTSNDITKYNVTLAVEYTEGIKGGMSATATIYLDKKENVLRVPAEAVTTENGRSIVQVMVNGQSQIKPVKIGLTTDRWVEVVEGLQEGEEVIIASSASSGNRQMFMGPGMGGPPPSGGATVRVQRGGTRQGG